MYLNTCLIQVKFLKLNRSWFLFTMTSSMLKNLELVPCSWWDYFIVFNYVCRLHSTCLSLWRPTLLAPKNAVMVAPIFVTVSTVQQFFWGTYQGVELLGHGVHAFLISFFYLVALQVAAPVWDSTSNEVGGGEVLVSAASSIVMKCCNFLVFISVIGILYIDLCFTNLSFIATVLHIFLHFCVAYLINVY